MTEVEYIDAAAFELRLIPYDDLDGRSACLDKFKAWANELPNDDVKTSYLNFIEYSMNSLRREREREQERVKVSEIVKTLPRPDWAAAAA